MPKGGRDIIKAALLLLGVLLLLSVATASADVVLMSRVAWMSLNSSTAESWAAKRGEVQQHSMSACEEDCIGLQGSKERRRHQWQVCQQAKPGLPKALCCWIKSLLAWWWWTWLLATQPPSPISESAQPG